MKHRVGMVLAAASVAGFALVGPGQADSGFQNKYPNGANQHDCGDDDTITYNGPDKMWPPNHKLQDVSITATDGSSNPVEGAANGTTLTVTIDLTDIAGGDGGPTHDPDWFITGMNPGTGDPSATVPFQLRSERSGKGEGRTYDISAHATFDNGAKSCDAAFQVLVPHDMRGGADWK